MATIKQIKSEYLEYLEIERNRAMKTVENYSRYLDRFVQIYHLQAHFISYHAKNLGVGGDSG
jgi:site-specific recombinase XerD